MVQVGVIGAAGYVGGELMRLLKHHPQVDSISAVSSSQPDKNVGEIHHDMVGWDLEFVSEVPSGVDVLFIARGHGQSKLFLESYTPESDQVIIDLSADFRIESGTNPFVYGLPEWQKDKISTSDRIANCGCFATAIQLGLLPLLESKSIDSDIHVQGITGSTGAGQKLVGTNHFTWRNANASVYKPLEHQHVDEVNQLKEAFLDQDVECYFIPMRGCFTRGILTSMYTKTSLSEKEIVKLYKDYYKNQPFTHLVDYDHLDVKLVVNTNNCLVKVEKKKDHVFVTSIIDNMIKGAAGQAVQNMNIRLGYEETQGLNLKPTVY